MNVRPDSVLEMRSVTRPRRDGYRLAACSFLGGRKEMNCPLSGILELYPQYVSHNSSTGNEVILCIFIVSKKNTDEQ